MTYLQDEKDQYMRSMDTEIGDRRLSEVVRDMHVKEGDNTYPITRKWVHASVSVVGCRPRGRGRGPRQRGRGTLAVPELCCMRNEDRYEKSREYWVSTLFTIGLYSLTTFNLLYRLISLSKFLGNISPAITNDMFLSRPGQDTV